MTKLILTHYEQLELSKKHELLDLVTALVFKSEKRHPRNGLEVRGEIVLLGCCFRGWPELVATEVIYLVCKGHNIKVV